jgi:hypothetical protein
VALSVVAIALLLLPKSYDTSQASAASAVIIILTPPCCVSNFTKRIPDQGQIHTQDGSVLGGSPIPGDLARPRTEVSICNVNSCETAGGKCNPRSYTMESELAVCACVTWILYIYTWMMEDNGQGPHDTR